MGQHQSKDELLYQQVSCGNIERIRTLSREGAGLEWTDKGGKTPLMVACMNPRLYEAAKTLIELGANVNRYCPGCEGGTPLHHAAKHGLEETVMLLLSHGANALVVNDDGQSALDVARIKGHTNVVRAIESHLCLFSGWLRELSGPVFLEFLVPHLASRKVWVVVLPCGSRTLRPPFKLELAIYTSLQDARPRIHLALWQANLEEPKINQHDPAVIVSDPSTRTRIKLAPINENDTYLLQRFCRACRGIPQVFHQNFPFNIGAPIVPASAQHVASAAPVNTFIDSAPNTRPPHAETSSSGSISQFTSPSANFDCCDNLKTASSTSKLEVGSTSNQTQNDHSSTSNNQSEHIQDQDESFVIVQSTPEDSVPSSAPSAPTTDDLVGEDGLIYYPSVDFGPLDSSPSMHESPEVTTGRKEVGGASSTCSICLDSPVEGACVPCGHMAGCMMCLNEIRTRKWGCPVCRANVEQVIRIYTV